ncbi:MAG TPA: hydantoinase/oxoprolinase family protein [Stellaceae bacterium]|nr:hydantoinase/oxoprolinase family protein [Stellaceae bacterium]
MARAKPKRYRLGVDVGGTHTDLVLLDSATGAIAVEKVASTPRNPALGVLDGVGRFIAKGVAPEAIEFFAHGTTITTNALLEMRGAKVGLLITKGFRAVQEVQSQVRDANPFDYFYRKPEPIAPQSLTREIGGRIDFSGAELDPLDEAAVGRAVRELKAEGVTAIAVCYLFAFANPEHEERTGRLIAAEHPEITVSLSSTVLPRIREWPRLSTTLLNAYLEPVLVGYIADLDRGLDARGLRTRQRFLMQSNGGVMPFSAAVAGGKTVHTLFSGPAAGAQASAWLAGAAANPGLVTLDMGGTSCDIAFIESGVPLEASEVTVARRPLGVPALDLTSISAGGGSIAWIDGGGLLAVGPRSAGADPGPVCYRRGGETPTVTDADLVLGFLNPDYFLGGTQRLDRAAAAAAIERRVGATLGMSAIEAAAGIRRIVDMRMADEIRVVAAKRGVDATDFTLLPFGGAGAVHAAAVAAEIGIARILVPPRPGAFSALGLLCTDIVHDYIRSELRPLDQVTPAHAESIFAALQARAAVELAAEGLDEKAARYVRSLDMRYSGQGYELPVPLAGNGRNPLTPASLAAARCGFDAAHARIHGHAARERPVEVVSYRLRVRVVAPKYRPETAARVRAHAVPRAAAKGERRVHFDGRRAVAAVLYERDRLMPGARFAGPAVVEQFDATTVVPPGWTASVDAASNLVLTKGAGRHG